MAKLKKGTKAIIATASALFLILTTVLVFFSCSISPDPDEPEQFLWKTTVPGSSWAIRDGRKLTNESIPSYFKNCSSITFQTEQSGKMNCVISDGQAEYSLAYLEFTSDEDGTLSVYNYVSEEYVKLTVHFSVSNTENNMRIKYSHSDFADFSICN